MQGLTEADIALGRAALAGGHITRPQLDAALGLLKSQQAPDLARALVRSGCLSPQKVEALRPQGASPQTSLPPPPPRGMPTEDAETTSEALTLHDGGFDPVAPPARYGGPAGPGFGGPASNIGGSGFGPGPDPSGSGRERAGGFPGDPGFGGAPAGGGFSPAGSGFGAPAGGGGFTPSGSGFGAPPGGGGFGAPPAGSGFGAPPGGGFGAPPGGGGFGAPPAGSGFGAPPAGSGFGAPPGGGGFGAPPGGGGFGAPPAGSGFGAPPGGSGFGAPPGGSGFGAPPGGSGFGAPPGGGGFGAPPGSGFGAPGGGGFGAPPGGSGFGAPPGGSGFGAPGGGGFGAPPGGGFGAPPGGSAFGAPVGGSAFGSPVGGSGFGAPVGGSGFGGGSPGGFAPVGSGFGGGPGGFDGGFGSDPAGAAFGEEGEAEKIGEWLVERELARGGMGVVYVGRHETTGELGAIKVMLTANGNANERKVKRFLREIDSNSKLTHDGIVRILDSGEFRGYPFFVMEYVEGKPLDRMLKEDLDLEIGMEILEKIARAVHYAHEQGIVHRDLKPANVIVREDMEPKLTDFGLAKDKDHQSVLTKTGAVLGTPYYLSPEQASGRSKAIDRRADIYSLGVIMYELATGRLPFVGQTTVELYNRIIHDEPVPPTKIKPQLTKALEIVCLKAMAKDPDDRYPDASAFADDVAALLGGGTIQAKADGALGRWVKRVRKRGSVPLVLGGTAVALALVIGGLVLRHKAQQTALHASLVRDELDGLKRATDETLATADERLAEGRTALRQSKIPSALAAAKESLDALDGLEARYGQLKHPLENTAPVEALVTDSTAARQAVRAEAIVLRARATMLRDEGGALERAERDLLAVLDEEEGVRPGDPQAVIAQGDLLVLRGRLGDALDRYGEALKRIPDSLRALYGRGRTILLKEDFEEGIAELSRAIELLQDAQAGAQADGAQAAAQEEGAPAGSKLEELTAEERQELHGLLLIERAHARLELDRREEALIDAQEASKLLQNGWRAKVIEANALARMGDWFQARDAFDAAVAMAPKDPAVFIARSEGLLRLGLADGAWDDANTAVSLAPGSLHALVARAEADEERRNYGPAERDAQSVRLQAQERHWRVAARANRILARLEAARGNLPEAHDHAKKARSLDEFAAAGRLLLAQIELDPFFESTHLEDAERLLRDVEKQRPGSVEARRGLGLILLTNFPSEPERAERKLLEARIADQRDPWTHTALARVFEAKAKQDPTQTKKFGDAARLEWELARRYERDVQRPEGRAFAEGLAEEKKGRALTAKAAAEHLSNAIKAYQRATWLDPAHSQAHTGLASIALLQGRKQAGEHLKRAIASNPRSVHTAVMNAYYQVTVEGVEENPTAAADALTRAIELRGETVALLERKILLEAMQSEAELGERAVSIAAAFQELRARDPLNLEILRAESALLSRLAERHRSEPASEALRERVRVVYGQETDLAKDLAVREEQAAELRKAARIQIDSGNTLSALESADKATRLVPSNADGWRLLAEAREATEELWGALAAGIRAAYLDDKHLGALFRLLRRAGTEAQDVPPDEIASYLKLDRDVLPFPDDLEKLLDAAPLVARAMVIEVSRDEAQKTFDELEAVTNHDPTRLVSHGMLGALSFGVRRDDYAIQSLGFVTTVRQDLGEASYLAALAAARSRARSRSLDVLAIHSLNAATRAGFAWQALGEEEPALERLRSSELWKRVEEPSKDEGS